MCTPQAVWVVDDDPSVRSGLSGLLRSLDYEVVTFASAMDLLAAVNTGLPRCIVSDVQMPGMTGVAMFLRLIGAGLRIPVIFITAYPVPELEADAMKNGAHAFLVKPVRPAELAAAVAAACAG